MNLLLRRSEELELQQLDLPKGRWPGRLWNTCFVMLYFSIERVDWDATENEECLQGGKDLIARHKQAWSCKQGKRQAVDEVLHRFSSRIDIIGGHWKLAPQWNPPRRSVPPEGDAYGGLAVE